MKSKIIEHNEIPYEKASRRLKQINLVMSAMENKRRISFDEFKDLKYCVDSMEKMFVKETEL